MQEKSQIRRNVLIDKMEENPLMKSRAQNGEWQ